MAAEKEKPEKEEVGGGEFGGFQIEFGCVKTAPVAMSCGPPTQPASRASGSPAVWV